VSALKSAFGETENHSQKKALNRNSLTAQQMAEKIPDRPMLHDARMSAIMRELKPFNNFMGFERGLWQDHTKYFVGLPKTRVLEGCFLDKS
jgi:hypothetical protein